MDILYATLRNAALAPSFTHYDLEKASGPFKNKVKELLLISLQESPPPRPIELKDIVLNVQDRKIELINSIALNDPKIDLSGIKTSLNAMTTSIIMSYSNMTITGYFHSDNGLRISNGIFHLILTNVEIEFMIGLEILDNKYCLDSVIQRCLNVDLNLVCLQDGKQEINKFVVPLTDHLCSDVYLKECVAEHFLKYTYPYLHHAFGKSIFQFSADQFLYIPVSEDPFRIIKRYSQSLDRIFGKVFDGVLNAANKYLIDTKQSKIALPDFSEKWWKEKGNQKRFRAVGGSISRIASLKRRTKVTYHAERRNLYLRAKVKLSQMSVGYSYFTEEVDLRPRSQNPLYIPTTHDAYVQFRVNRLGDTQLQLDCPQFEILDFEYKNILSIVVPENGESSDEEVCYLHDVSNPDAHPRQTMWCNHFLTFHAISRLTEVIERGLTQAISSPITINNRN